MDSQQQGPHGVGGWLALLITGMLWLGPLMVIGRTLDEFSTTEREYPGLAQMPEWSSFKTIEWVALLVFCAISIYGGLGLAKKRTPDAVSRAKLILWFYPISVIIKGMLIPVVMIKGGGTYVAANIPPFIASLISVGIWTAYLNRSKRVRNTYGLTSSTSLEGTRQAPNTSSKVATTEDYGTRTSSPTPVLFQGGEGNITSIASEQETTVDKDRIYAAIAKELETGATEKGLWTRLFAESGGDEKQTKVLYIKQRAERLIANERLRLEQLARESAERSHIEKLANAAERKRLKEQEKRERAVESALGGVRTSRIWMHGNYIT